MAVTIPAVVAIQEFGFKSIPVLCRQRVVAGVLKFKSIPVSFHSLEEERQFKCNEEAMVRAVDEVASTLLLIQFLSHFPT